MISICLLVSGELGYRILEELFLDKDLKLTGVFTNKSSASIIFFCKKNKIPIFIGNPRNGRARGFIRGIESDLLLSVNYLFLIEEDVIQLPKKYAINFHGSLLPKYRGRTPHVWAIINGESETGITAHVIDETVDTGKIIKQIVVPIEDNDTGASILSKFLVLYPTLVKDVIQDVKKDRLTFYEQDEGKATFYGKRIPEDGRINWNWSRERIINWIRAQANPYPGAYFYFNNSKVIVNQASISDMGYSFDFDNGRVLYSENHNLIIKSTNGAISLERLVFEKNEFNIIKGDLLQ